MSNYPTDKLTSVFAVNGDKRLPPATAALAGSGRASQYEGFKIENSMPLSQGGIPPFREDFNGIFNLFSQFLMWYQQGGIMTYDPTLDYEVGNEILYQGNKYRCIQDNGVSSAVVAPGDVTYWELINNYGDPVRYGTVQSLTSGEQLQARTNIGAVSDSDFNTLVGAKLTKDGDYLNLLNRNGGYLTRFPWIDVPNVFSRNAPVMCTLLWSGDSDQGDLTLDYPITDYDVLMFIGGTNDSSPGSANMIYGFMPVWLLKEVVTNQAFMGLSIPTITVLSQGVFYWRINTATSTVSELKHYGNNQIHMWRVIGMRYTQAAAPTIIQS